jgi:HPt (histidine-containing phosphotransfer) domain-containing protein
MASIDQSVLDGIKEMAGDTDNEFLITLIQLYVNSAPEKLQKMKAALARKDGKTASFEAHSLKSSSASLGAMAVSKIAGEIEKETKGGHVSSEINLKFSLFEKEVSLAITELQTYLTQNPSQLPKKAA